MIDDSNSYIHSSEIEMISTIRLSYVNIFGGLIFGYNTGVIAGVLLCSPWSQLDDLEKGLLTCSVLLGAMVASLFAGLITEKIGRTKPMFFIGWLSIIGAIGSSFVPTSLWYVIPFRFILGLAIGLSGVVCPTYVGEMASQSARGKLGTVFQIAITVGIFISDVIGFAFKDVKHNYRWMFGFGLLPGVCLLALLFVIPESTVWIEKRNMQKNTLLLLNKDQTGGMGIKLLLTKSVGRFALFIGCILAINNQLSGINAFIYFSPQIFQTAGINSGSGPMIAAISLMGWNVITTFISTMFIDKIGKKKLMLYGTVAMSLSCITLAILFLTIKGELLGYISVGLLFIFIAAFEASAGPLFWTMVIEIFPDEMRDIGSSILNALQWTFNIALSFSFLKLVSVIGQAAIFFIFGGVGTFCLAIMIFYLPNDSNHQSSSSYQPIE